MTWRGILRELGKAGWMEDVNDISHSANQYILRLHSNRPRRIWLADVVRSFLFILFDSDLVVCLGCR